MASSNGNIFRVTGPLCGEFTGHSTEFPAQRPVTRSFNVSLICAWTNGWVNNRDAGDLRRHHAHYDVTVMWIRVLVKHIPMWPWNGFIVDPGANALPQPTLTFCPLDHIVHQLNRYRTRQCILKCCLLDVSHFVEASISRPQWRVCWLILGTGFQRSLETLSWCQLCRYWGHRRLSLLQCSSSFHRKKDK